ncbi:MAG: tetratricopeptide repeat protein [Phycisphaerae bacterium]|nr:tetratricopeptide repeat protein [Phycisphaerae bacterium]MDD5381209.1 tetratricopeptide repeat protein [Phycisphaerae bacterium]
MKKILLIIVCVLFFTAGVSFGQNATLANQDKQGLNARSIEQVLRLDDEEVDLGTAVLIVSEQWSDVVEGRRYLSDLDDMAIEIRGRLKKKRLQANYKAIEVINKYLFDELGFRAVKDANNPDDLFLHSVLDRKRGYCLSLSVLYLSLGERLGLPLYGVVVPGHFFVRYDDGRVRFNIETTSKGGYADDEHYRKEFKVPKNSDGIYMENLNKIQTLGCFFNNLGNSYNEVGDINQAMLAIERAVEINPGLAESRMNLGNIYLKKDKVDDAIREYNAALEIDPGNAKIYNGLGNAYAEQGRWNEAASQFMRSVDMDPDFTEAYKNLATAYCEQERFGLAEMQLKHAIGLEPKDPNLYKQLGDIYTKMGDYKNGISQYKKALGKKSNLAEAHFGLAFCYNKLDLFDDELQEYKKALAIKPDMTAALVNLGNAYFNRHNYDAAIEQYKKAAQITPKDIMIHYNLGAAYSNNGQYEQAASEYGKAIEIDPKIGDAHKGLAFAFYRLEKYDLAWQHIKTAEKLGVEVSKDLLAAIEDEIK